MNFLQTSGVVLIGISVFGVHVLLYGMAKELDSLLGRVAEIERKAKESKPDQDKRDFSVMVLGLGRKDMQ